MMRRIPLVTASLTLASMIAVFAQTKPSMGSVEFSDVAGDVGPIRTVSGSTEKTFPGFDVVTLSIVSDGKQITFATTLKSPPAEVATRVVEIYVDVDNSTKTGAALDYTPFSGFEFRGLLDACLELSNSTRSCAGASATPTDKLVRRWAVVSLDRFKGAKESDGVEQVVDAAGFFTALKPTPTPILGSVVQAALAYDALKVASGRTIRLVVREGSTHPTPTGTPQGFFPEVLLTLK
jgi:hypothetical protein